MVPPSSEPPVPAASLDVEMDDKKEVPTQPNFEEWLQLEMPWLNNDIERLGAALDSKPVIVQVANNTTNINIQVDQSSNTTNKTANCHHTTNNTVNNQSTSSSNTVNNNNLNQTAKMLATSLSPREIREGLAATQSSVPTANVSAISSSPREIREGLCAADEIINSATQSSVPTAKISATNLTPCAADEIIKAATSSSVPTATANVSATTTSSSPREIREDLCAADEIINSATQSSVPTGKISATNLTPCAADEIIESATSSSVPTANVSAASSLKDAPTGINSIRPRRSIGRSIGNFYRRKGCTSPQANVPKSKLRALIPFRRPHIKKSINDKVRHVPVVTAVPTDTAVPSADEEYDRVRSGTSGKYMKMTGKRGNNEV